MFYNSEIEICAYKQGVKLVPRRKYNCNSTQEGIFSLENLFKMPLSIYFLDGESRLKNCNSENLEMVQADSLKNVVNKNAFDILRADYVKEVMQNDKLVLDSEKKIFFDEQFPNKEGSFIEGLSIKLPWYNQDNKVIGLAGFTALNHKYSLADSLKHLVNLGLFQQQQDSFFPLPGLKLKNSYLTRREKEILCQIMRGKSARLVAISLSISIRTVQTHIENIKNKMGVNSKAELIEKAFSLGFN